MRWLIVAWFFTHDGLPNMRPIKFAPDRQTCIEESARLNTTQDSAYIFCTYFEPENP